MLRVSRVRGIGNLACFEDFWFRAYHNEVQLLTAW